jgi:RNA polymerase sigma-70 factor (ECF subfamily)
MRVPASRPRPARAERQGMKAVQAVPLAEPSDESLLASIARGDHRAFTVLVERHSGRFYAHAWRTTGSKAEAEDAVQDSFLKLWRNPSAFDAGKGNKFTTWFYRVVTNAAIDLQRRRRETPDMDMLERLPASGMPQDQAMLENEREAALETAIAALPERQRSALNLCFYEGLSNAEAAGILGVKVKALESLLMRAKATLKDRLATQGWLETEDGDGQA